MSCIKTVLSYQGCRHYYDTMYTFCGGDHANTLQERRKCWESQPKSKRGLSTRVGTTDKNYGCLRCFPKGQTGLTEQVLYPGLLHYGSLDLFGPIDPDRPVVSKDRSRSSK